MTNENFTQPWERSSTVYQRGKPIGYRFGYGANQHGDGPKGRIAYVETDDHKIADFIQSAPDMYRALRETVASLQAAEVQIQGEWGMPMTHEEMERQDLFSEEVALAKLALAKARGEL